MGSIEPWKHAPTSGLNGNQPAQAAPSSKNFKGPTRAGNAITKYGHEERYQRLAPAHSSWRGWSVRGVTGYLRSFLERPLVDVATRILIAMCKLKQIINLFGGGVSWGAERLLFTTRRVAVIVDIFGFSLRWWVAELGQGCMSCYGLNLWEKKSIEVDSLHSLGSKFIHRTYPPQFLALEIATSV